MKRSLASLMLVCTALLTSFGARAGVPPEAAQSARKAQYQMITHFGHGHFLDDTQIALNNVVKMGVAELAAAGFQAAAQEIWKEWATKYSKVLIHHTDNVGDHAPLYAWLNTYYKFLEAKLGHRRCAKMHLTDIPILNFVIPVSVQPGGDMRNGDRWPKPEYRRHFVPFASIASYWITYGACRSNTPASYKLLCERVALVFKGGVREHVAPRLSDYIYDTWGKGADQNSPVDFSALDRYFATELAKIPSTN